MTAAVAPTTRPPADPEHPLLRLTDVHTYYGHIHALQGVDLEVRRGEIVTLLGANGAGKSTTLKTINGLLHPKQGRIEFDGRDITRVPAHELVRRGIAQSPEGRRMFARMTVMENLQMGAYTRTDKAAINDDYGRVFTLFPRLQERRNQKAGTLSGGEQQMLAIGRALMTKPALMLLDEPSMGLAPILVEQIFAIIRDINQQGMTMLVVEQNALMALGVADRGYVLQTGRIVRSGDSATLLADPEVKRAYLGG
ncbi:MAG TPA: ABC transporter ATP-binding protein [Candidatus Baltobacteraceae bacterium]|nr:ABC transporter ATP-binding protein [Candidatus Baltobacteraceae bacterium]